MIQKCGPFDFLLCVGSFFSQKDDAYEKYIKGCYEIPLPIYILGPNSAEEREFYPENLNEVSDINPNIVYLGKVGRYINAKGLRIGFLSGKEAKKGEELDNFTHSKNDFNAFTKLISNQEDVVDVLITSCWPTGINKLQGETFEPANPSNVVGDLVGRLKPWYHFSGLENKYFEPKPYLNKTTTGDICSITRFIGLGSVGSKEKSLYALNIEIPRTLTPAERTCTSLQLSPFAKDVLQFPGYSRYQLSDQNPPKRKGNHKKPGEAFKKKKQEFVAENSCWFCLTSHKFEKHLVVTMKSRTYVALSRGGIVLNHLNIMPIDHFGSLNLTPDSVYEEVEQFKSLIKKVFNKLGSEVVFYERNYRSFHAQLHCVPIDSDVASRIKEVFEERIAGLKLPYKYVTVGKHIKDVVQSDKSYFYIQFPSGEEIIVFIEDNFPLNFDRTVLCEESLLNRPHRINWVSCALPDNEEATIVNELKIHFNTSMNKTTAYET